MQTATHRIDLHQFSLDVDAGQLAAFDCNLTPDERERAGRFVVPADGAEFTVGRGRLREILARYVGRPPGDLRFAYAAHGKPRLDMNCPVPFFNLSHTGTQAVLAVASDLDVGIDIERVRPVERGLARRFFSVAEVATLEALPADQWREGFFRCWTRKEAVLKALGVGFSMSLASFDVSIAEGEPPRVLRIDADHGAPHEWSVFEVRPSPETIVAVAARAPDGRAIELVQIDVDEPGR